VIQTRRTDIDTDDVRRRPTERILRRLPRATASDENVEIVAIRFAGPQKMVLRTMAIGVPPLIASAIEIRDGGGYGCVV
jgi:hypothetical protein